MATRRSMAALGSSFAAGPGIAPVVDGPAMRSGRNYAHLVAKALDAQLTDLTISGATTDTIIDRHQRLLWRKFPPQLERLPHNADLVTITAGGNDLNYIGSMLRVAWANHLRNHHWSHFVGDALGKKGFAHIAPAEVERAASGLTRIVESVRARAPDARILLVDYLTIVNEQTVFSVDAPFGASELAAIRELAAQLALAFETAATTTGTELIRASGISLEHALGSEQPWIFGFRPAPIRAMGASFHPNALGMQAVADAILQVVDG